MKKDIDNQRVIFVGVHNKPAKEPLDSSTVSGKRIDKIIKTISNRIDCVKTNLWEVEWFPYVDEQIELEILWHIKYDPKPDDIIVLLGGVVHRSFPKIISKNLVYLPHPSLQFSKITVEDYIKTSVIKINNKINQIRQVSCQ